MQRDTRTVEQKYRTYTIRNHIENLWFYRVDKPYTDPMISAFYEVISVTYNEQPRHDGDLKFLNDLDLNFTRCS